MTDIAQLREALADYNTEGALVGDDVFDVVFDAAREFLTIREAGALIITPDQDGEWPEWIDAVPKRFLRAPIFIVLDALRDAMPDGES